MNVLDLFSGVGGFSLGLERSGMKTVAFCEIEPYPQAVLRKNFPGVPIYDDVRTITAARLRADGIGGVNLVCGGDPCQPHSHAGKRKGKGDDRYLWPEMLRVVDEFDPTWVVNENVTGSESNMVLDQKIFDLEAIGYECQPFNIPVVAVGGGHERQRIWLVAHSSRKGRPGHQQDGSSPRCVLPSHSVYGDRIADSWDTLARRSGGVRSEHGLPVQMVRSEVKGYGNSVCPIIPEIIGRAIMQIEGLNRAL